MSAGKAATQALTGVVSECRLTHAVVLTGDIATVVHSRLTVHTRPAIGTSAAEVRARRVRTRTVVEAGGGFAGPRVLQAITAVESRSAVAFVASGEPLVIDAGAIVLARMEGVAGSTGDIAIGTHSIGVVAGENDERGL